MCHHKAKGSAANTCTDKKICLSSKIFGPEIEATEKFPVQIISGLRSIETFTWTDIWKFKNEPILTIWITEIMNPAFSNIIWGYFIGLVLVPTGSCWGSAGTLTLQLTPK